MFAAPAAAQDAPGDPEPSSPSGTVYQLPVDRARQDAAPRHRPAASPSRPSSGGGGGGAAAPPAGAGSIRSENGFNTSTHVPGTSGTSATASGSQAGGAKAGGKDGKDRKRGKGGSGANGEAAPAPTADTRGARLAGATSEPSGLRAGLLVALASVVGVGLGLASRMSRRFR